MGDTKTFMANLAASLGEVISSILAVTKTGFGTPFWWLIFPDTDMAIGLTELYSKFS